MGKKRKNSPEQTPIAAPVVTELAAPEPPVSQPAVSEEKAAEIVAAASPAVVSEPPPREVATSEPPPAIEASTSEPPPASAAPATKRPKKKRAPSKKRSVRPPPVVSREALDEKIDRLEAKLEEKKDAVEKAAREGFGSKPDDDDTSVPPIDLEVHDAFFAAGEAGHHPITKESGSFAAVDPRHAQKMSATAHARRAHLSRYVKIAVGAAAGILMLGFAIKSFRGHPNDEPVRREVTHVAAIQQPVQQPEQPKAITPPPVENADNAKVDEAKTDEKKTDENVAAADAKAAEETVEKKDDLPPEKPKNAWQEKQAAKAALERGANSAAIQAGERSVALDPSDGEAWLVLGGAYQAMGNASQARRCYNACVSQGKKGPISDCKDMLGSL